jgi:hypothetical protein
MNPSSTEKIPIEEKYIKTLSEKEYKAYLIAKSHLGMSFQIEKSNGFLKWKKENIDK